MKTASCWSALALAFARLLASKRRALRVLLWKQKKKTWTSVGLEQQVVSWIEHVIGPQDPWDDPGRPLDVSKGSDARSDGGARTKEFDAGGERTVCNDCGVQIDGGDETSGFSNGVDGSVLGWGNRRSRTWSPVPVGPIVVQRTEPGTVEGEDIFDTKDELGTPSRWWGRGGEAFARTNAPLCTPWFPDKSRRKGGIEPASGVGWTRDWARPSTTHGTVETGAQGGFVDVSRDRKRPAVDAGVDGEKNVDEPTNQDPRKRCTCNRQPAMLVFVVRCELQGTHGS